MPCKLNVPCIIPSWKCDLRSQLPKCSPHPGLSMLQSAHFFLQSWHPIHQTSVDPFSYLFIHHIHKKLPFIIPWSGNLELNSWHRIFWEAWNPLTTSLLASQFLSCWCEVGVLLQGFSSVSTNVRKATANLGVLWIGSFREKFPVTAQLPIFQNTLCRESGDNNSWCLLSSYYVPGIVLRMLTP